MASTSHVGPDTLVTIKVNLQGSARRFKLPLRDVGINVLETKLRGILGIPAEVDAIFERYSDSAAAYVVLDQTNVSVYKQLYRAAKAKQKLKLRISIPETQAEEPVEETVEPSIEESTEPTPQESSEEQEPKEGPKPASVSDEVEEEAPKLAQSLPNEEPAALSMSQVGRCASHEELNEAVSKALENATAITEQFLKSEAKAVKDRALAVEAMAARLAGQLAQPMQPIRPTYAVCCNSCDKTVPEVHYHCSTCDDGDFDLCQECVDQGIACYGASHWLIKRFVKDGVIINSTTERIAPKEKPQPQQQQQQQRAQPVQVTPGSYPTAERIIPVFTEPQPRYSSIRTCNCCVQELPEVEFVHCLNCDDFDLCRACFAKNRHGHHPKHAFVAAVEGTRLEPQVANRLGAGRGQRHNAICDGCDDAILGVRHKCLNCPDWDYCGNCVVNAHFIHPGHRFVSIYEPLDFSICRSPSRPTHAGICCDGPLCSSARNNGSFIVGDRYKCAVCNDTDFCEACEASPANTHNKTHPLIKFKTPVRHVSVTTTGENENGRSMPAMGDRCRRSTTTSSRATETVNPPALSTNVQTVVDVKPEEPSVKAEKEEPLIKIEAEEPVEKLPEVKVEEIEEKPAVPEVSPADLVAVFVKDSIADGTVFGPDHVFEQTWVLRNEGTVAWPAGCSVKFVGGDYMGHVDPNHPAATQDLESSNESTICYSPILPDQEYPFTVLLRTPQRCGRIVSNWRLTAPDGHKFGHRLWCDVVVEKPKVVLPPASVELVKEKEVVVTPEPEIAPKEEEVPEMQQSQMIFPKLEKESPVASIHQDTKSESAVTFEEYEDCDDDEWDAAGSEEGFLTDEEYDILDASDEEYIEARARK
ncbi:hypothetical protein QBC35DRAFT_448380 [Podospora australis]|uniref:ZZ-type domain-containing protein n=1 Tax=Podospora australis TaxID=1536484 RepID=A0AAN6X091_9PEZI|nr:hypothetical protein QBC35DRAFT_448380 [Podospora australis]